MRDDFESVGAPVLPCQGTMMAWVDMSKFLSKPSFAAEKELWLELCNKYKIILTTGESCFSNKPGMFRVCFAYPDIGNSNDYTCATDQLKKRL